MGHWCSMCYHPLSTFLSSLRCVQVLYSITVLTIVLKSRFFLCHMYWWSWWGELGVVFWGVCLFRSYYFRTIKVLDSLSIFCLIWSEKWNHIQTVTSLTFVKFRFIRSYPTRRSFIFSWIRSDVESVSLSLEKEGDKYLTARWDHSTCSTKTYSGKIDPPTVEDNIRPEVSAVLRHPFRDRSPPYSHSRSTVNDRWIGRTRTQRSGYFTFRDEVSQRFS